MGVSAEPELEGKTRNPSFVIIAVFGFVGADTGSVHEKT